MLNDLMVVSADKAEVFSGLKDKELLKVATEFQALGKKTLENTYAQFKILADIRNRKLFVKDFPTYEACTEALFGIGKAQANRMVQVAETFLNSENSAKYMEFTPSALVEMLPKGDEKKEETLHLRKLDKLIEDAVITPDDTKIEIREAVNEKLRGKTKEKAEVVKAKKGEEVAKLLGDLTAYAKKKKDKYLETLVKELTKAINNK